MLLHFGVNLDAGLHLASVRLLKEQNDIIHMFWTVDFYKSYLCPTWKLGFRMY